MSEQNNGNALGNAVKNENVDDDMQVVKPDPVDGAQTPDNSSSSKEMAPQEPEVKQRGRIIKLRRDTDVAAPVVFDKPHTPQKHFNLYKLMQRTADIILLHSERNGFDLKWHHKILKKTNVGHLYIHTRHEEDQFNIRFSILDGKTLEVVIFQLFKSARRQAGMPMSSRQYPLKTILENREVLHHLAEYVVQRFAERCEELEVEQQEQQHDEPSYQMVPSLLPIQPMSYMGMGPPAQPHHAPIIAQTQPAAAAASTTQPSSTQSITLDMATLVRMMEMARGGSGVSVSMPITAPDLARSASQTTRASHHDRVPSPPPTTRRASSSASASLSRSHRYDRSRSRSRSRDSRGSGASSSRYRRGEESRRRSRSPEYSRRHLHRSSHGSSRSRSRSRSHSRSYRHSGAGDYYDGHHGSDLASPRRQQRAVSPEKHGRDSAHTSSFSATTQDYARSGQQQYGGNIGNQSAEYRPMGYNHGTVSAPSAQHQQYHLYNNGAGSWNKPTIQPLPLPPPPRAEPAQRAPLLPLPQGYGAAATTWYPQTVNKRNDPWSAKMVTAVPEKMQPEEERSHRQRSEEPNRDLETSSPDNSNLDACVLQSPAYY